MIKNIDQLLDSFVNVANLSGFKISISDISYDFWEAPHRQKGLPSNQQAVYTFSLPKFNNLVLKIGKAGPKSNARFLSQHYNPDSSGSNLAKSLLNSINFWEEIQIQKPQYHQICGWIKANTDRNNFYVSDKFDKRLLSLFEIFLQCRLSPVFEK